MLSSARSTNFSSAGLRPRISRSTPCSCGFFYSISILHRKRLSLRLPPIPDFLRTIPPGYSLRCVSGWPGAVDPPASHPRRALPSTRAPPAVVCSDHDHPGTASADCPDPETAPDRPDAGSHDPPPGGSALGYPVEILTPSANHRSGSPAAGTPGTAAPAPDAQAAADAATPTGCTNGDTRSVPSSHTPGTQKRPTVSRGRNQ